MTAAIVFGVLGIAALLGAGLLGWARWSRGRPIYLSGGWRGGAVLEEQIRREREQRTERG